MEIADPHTIELAKQPASQDLGMRNYDSLLELNEWKFTKSASIDFAMYREELLGAREVIAAVTRRMFPSSSELGGWLMPGAGETPQNPDLYRFLFVSYVLSNRRRHPLEVMIDFNEKISHLGPRSSSHHWLMFEKEPLGATMLYTDINRSEKGLVSCQTKVITSAVWPQGVDLLGVALSNIGVLEIQSALAYAVQNRQPLP